MGLKKLLSKMADWHLVAEVLFLLAALVIIVVSALL